MAYSTPSYSPRKRTVRCSYCGATGHNRAGCTDHKERIETLREEHGDEHYTVRCYDQKKRRKAAKAKTRSCSYCGETGHNRATCPVLKAHIASTREKNAAFRQALHDCFAGIGFGIGAVVSSQKDKQRVENTPDEHWNVPHIVTEINWTALNMWNTGYSYFDDDTSPFFTKPLSGLASTRQNRGAWMKDRDIMTMIVGESTTNLYLSEDTNWKSKDVDYYFVQIESPVPATTPPSDWLDGGVAEIKKAYKDRKSYQGVL